MQNCQRKALKSFVLHIRVRIGIRQQPGLLDGFRSRIALPAYELNDCSTRRCSCDAAVRSRIGTIMVTPQNFPQMTACRPVSGPAGICKLIETAVSRGDQDMAQRLADCRAN
jgi:hypothetical protein